MEARRRKYESRAAECRSEAQSESNTAWNEISAELDNAIANLNGRERDVIVLHYLGGHSLSDAANVLGISAEAARQRSSRGIEHLRQDLLGNELGISVAALGTTMTCRKVSTRSFTLTNWPGQICRSLFGNSALSFTVPVVWST